MNHSAAIRNFVAFHRYGVLSTHSVTNPGYPFGSMTPFDIDEGGRPLVWVSLIAEHYRNLKASPRGSLTVTQHFAGRDPQARGRATLLCDFVEVEPHEREGLMASYAARFPSSSGHEIAHNFTFLRGVPMRLRWIGGFGDIGWVSAEEYSRAPLDPLSYRGFEFVEELNVTRRRGVRALAQSALSEVLPDARVEAVGVSSAELSLMVTSEFETRSVEVPFPTPVNSIEEARACVLSMIATLTGPDGAR